MDAGIFVERIRRLHVLQSVTLHFAENGMMGLMRLHSMIKSNVGVHLSEEKNMLAMLAVLESQRWGSSQNRNYTVYGISVADDGWLSQIARDVENIEVAEHGAKGIMSGRQKMREEATKNLVVNILTQNFINEVEEWGVQVSHKMTEQDGIQVLTFFVTCEGVTLTSVSIDGFSGRIALDGMFGDECYIQPKQVQQTLLASVIAKLEKLTRAA